MIPYVSLNHQQSPQCLHCVLASSELPRCRPANTLECGFSLMANDGKIQICRIIYFQRHRGKGKRVQSGAIHVGGHLMGRIMDTILPRGIDNFFVETNCTDKRDKISDINTC